jgi:outer membrane protein assembly factor BamC
MMNLRTTQRYAGAALLVGLLGLAGCSTINQALDLEESVDYKSTVKGDPLSIPPDLTQANNNARYRAPEGSTSYNQYAQNQQAAATAPGSERVLPNLPGVEVRRDGDLRWLVVDKSPDVIFQKVVDFWGDEGFTVASQDPLAGIIQTDWAENRAKIPQDWIRSALGSLIDTVYDSGERDRFRTRMERVNGKTEVYISHQHMVETPTQDGTTFKWVFGKEDPNLNAAMLARLMVYLGTDTQRARTLIENAEAAPNALEVEQVADQALLTLNEPFDRAWRRVGVAIDSAGFSVEDRDRSAGDYYIRYLDVDTGEKIEQQNFIGRLFGSKNTAEAATYRINVSQQGGDSLVRVLDQSGQAQSDPTARRIITVLKTNMR